MKGDLVPDLDHIAHYCGGANVYEDGTIDGVAFRLRRQTDGPEQYLSVNWLEHLHPADRERQLANLRLIFSSKGWTLSASSRFAVHQVRALIDYVQSNSPDHRLLSVRHEPLANDASHCGIYGYELEDDIVADLIAEAVEDTYPGRG